MTITSGTVTRGNGVASSYEQNWRRQNPITPDPLSYSMVSRVRRVIRSNLKPGWAHTETTLGVNAGSLSVQAVNFARNGTVTPDLPMDRLYNAAYEKFTDVVRGDIAEAAVSLAERREAYSMMLNRTIRLINAVRAFRQLDFRAAAGHLGVLAPSSAQRKRWSNPRQWGASWLEWHFGWSPTLGDIHSAIQIMDGTFPWFKVTESSGWKLDYSLTRNNGPYVGTGTEKFTFQGMSYCRISSEIEVSDLTLLKANQLGLINPASVVWELIPFSFLADWFGTIGLWLGQFTAFSGLALRRPQHVYFIRGTDRVELNSALFGEFWFEVDTVAVKRIAGSIPGPSIALRPLRGLSVTRGLTAISLILGLFAPR